MTLPWFDRILGGVPVEELAVPRPLEAGHRPERLAVPVEAEHGELPDPAADEVGQILQERRPLLRLADAVVDRPHQYRIRLEILHGHAPR
jgi:hypothetical protein